MKTVLKSLVVGLMVLALSFSPALAGLAKAGGFNFEGISSIKTDDTQSFEKQSRGLMFNFSFGGPKDYKKKTQPQVAMFEDSTEFWSVVGFVAVVAFIYFTVSDNDSDTVLIPPDNQSPENDMPAENDMTPENDMPAEN